MWPAYAFSVGTDGEFSTECALCSGNNCPVQPLNTTGIYPETGPVCAYNVMMAIEGVKCLAV